MIAERYGLAKNTISDIKKNDKIIHFKQEMCDMGMSKKAKVMKLRNDAQHDKGVYLWFKQKRMEKQKRTRDQDEQEFVCEFQELGYSMDENEIHTWLNSDSSDPTYIDIG